MPHTFDCTLQSLHIHHHHHCLYVCTNLGWPRERHRVDETVVRINVLVYKCSLFVKVTVLASWSDSAVIVVYDNRKLYDSQRIAICNRRRSPQLGAAADVCHTLCGCYGAGGRSVRASSGAANISYGGVCWALCCLLLGCIFGGICLIDLI